MAVRIEPTSLDEVRPDHLGRYLFAARWLKSHGIDGSLLDMGCGVGYGSSLLADQFAAVHSIELSDEAEAHYRQHFARNNIRYDRIDAFTAELDNRYEAAVCFEFLEHVHDADKIVAKIARASDILICSTPNELVRPWAQPPINPDHVRHYTPDEFEDLLLAGGFKSVQRFSQVNSRTTDVVEEFTGKFLVAVATK